MDYETSKIVCQINQTERYVKDIAISPNEQIVAFRYPDNDDNVSTISFH